MRKRRTLQSSSDSNTAAIKNLSCTIAADAFNQTRNNSYIIAIRIITNNFNKKTISKFIIFSILSALVSCVILIPTLFNLLNGRLSNLDFSFNYLSVDWFQVLSSLYNMSIGSFIEADHFDYGSTTLYISIFAFVLIICYFFNQKISKKTR